VEPRWPQLAGSSRRAPPRAPTGCQGLISRAHPAFVRGRLVPPVWFDLLEAAVGRCAGREPNWLLNTPSRPRRRIVVRVDDGDRLAGTGGGARREAVGGRDLSRGEPGGAGCRERPDLEVRMRPIGRGSRCADGSAASTRQAANTKALVSCVHPYVPAGTGGRGVCRSGGLEKFRVLPIASRDAREEVSPPAILKGAYRVAGRAWRNRSFGQ